MSNIHARWLARAALGVAVVVSAPALAAGVDELPQEIQDELYNPEMMDPMQPLGESAYRD